MSHVEDDICARSQLKGFKLSSNDGLNRLLSGTKVPFIFPFQSCMGIGFLPPITHILGRNETLLKNLLN